jgi:hypothetical protein
MSQPTIRIIDSGGNAGRLKARLVATHAETGLGSFMDGVAYRGRICDRVFVYHRPEASTLPHESRPKHRTSPTIGRIVSRLVDQFSGRDSGFSTLPYPMRSGGNGPAHRTLSRQGAGL